jgi:hypothetical protein
MITRRLNHTRAGASSAVAPRSSWEERAACAGLLTFADWPVDSQREWCSDCPVRNECLRLGLQTIPTAKDAKDSGLVWGGMLPREVADLIELRNCNAPAGQVA